LKHSISENYKFLILKACAGLGNRLITLCNAIEYAKKTNRTLYVDWSDGQFGEKGKNVFYKYFQLYGARHESDFDKIGNINSNNAYPPLWGKQPKDSLYDLYIQDHSTILKKFVPYSFKGGLSKVHGYWRQKKPNNNKTGSDWNALKALFNRDNISFGGNYRKNINNEVVFFADFCPEFSPTILRNNILLNDTMQKHVDDLVSKMQLAKNTIGIHIRMTDKQPQSELVVLKEQILRLNINNPQLFIASDSEIAEEYFSKHFKNVLFTKKWRPENTGKKMGMHQFAIRNQNYANAELMLRESITDMWLLSKCKYLIYQSNSSFSKISAILKNDSSKTFTW